jgi:hypothetical protein
VLFEEAEGILSVLIQLHRCLIGNLTAVGTTGAGQKGYLFRFAQTLPSGIFGCHLCFSSLSSALMMN